MFTGQVVGGAVARLRVLHLMLRTRVRRAAADRAPVQQGTITGAVAVTMPFILQMPHM